MNKLKTFSFNLNSTIKVKLLERGYERLAELHNQYLGSLPNWEKRNAEYYQLKADNEGYTNFQAWNFMEYFGEVTHVDMPGFYELDIKVELETPLNDDKRNIY